MVTPDFDDYAAAIRKYGPKTLKVEMDVLQLTMLLSTLQLALRHPRYPARMRPLVEDFVAGAIESLTQLSPVIGQVMLAGMDPSNDVDAKEPAP